MISKYGNHFIDTRTKEGKQIAIKAGVWVVSWLDLPLGGLFLNFRRLVIHLGHGTPLKCIGLTEKNGKIIKKLYYKLNNTNISYSLASSEFLQSIISSCMGLPKKRILVQGQPRTDALFTTKENVSEISDEYTNILYAPTWRQHSPVKLFPFTDFNAKELEDFLIQNKIKIFVRFHPAYEESIPKDILSINNIKLFSAKKYLEIMDYINLFDALITDYSSIYLDYMLLVRPMVFLPYDLREYENSVGFTMDYSENTPWEKPTTQKQFLEILLKIKNDPEYQKAEIIELNEKLNNENKNACKAMADFIVSH